MISFDCKTGRFQSTIIKSFHTLDKMEIKLQSSSKKLKNFFKRIKKLNVTT